MIIRDGTLSFMMRSFALSFSIFLRAVPMWGFLVALIYVATVTFRENPIILIFLVLLASGATMHFMMFSHIRSGLSVLGETTPPDLSKLVRKSIRFCFFSGMWSILVTALSVVGFFTAGYLGMFDWDLMLEMVVAGDQDGLDQMFGASSVYAYWIVATTLSQLAYCCIAVPMAANAAACSPKARDYEIFWGFGSSAIRMLILITAAGTIVTVGLIAYFGFGILVIASSFDVSDPAALFLQMQQAPDWRGMITIVGLVAIPILGFIWWISIWCAGATVAFVDRRRIYEAKFKQELERIYEAPMAKEDLRALRMSRMTPAAPATG